MLTDKKLARTRLIEACDLHETLVRAIKGARSFVNLRDALALAEHELVDAAADYIAACGVEEKGKGAP